MEQSFVVGRVEKSKNSKNKDQKFLFKKSIENVQGKTFTNELKIIS